MINLSEENNIILKHSTPFNRQGNVLAESTNKRIVSNMKNIIFQNKWTWDIMLKYSLWEDRMTTKNSIGQSPFHLVYGIDAVFHVQLSFRVIKFL